MALLVVLPTLHATAHGGADLVARGRSVRYLVRHAMG
jgi:hypothetical protein